jgi:hypothetical protein
MRARGWGRPQSAPVDLQAGSSSRKPAGLHKYLPDGGPGGILGDGRLGGIQPGIVVVFAGETRSSVRQHQQGTPALLPGQPHNELVGGDVTVHAETLAERAALARKLRLSPQFAVVGCDPFDVLSRFGIP